MSVRELPPETEPEIARPPSRRFTILFASAMIVIAIGYTWVWQAKTARVVPEPPPALVIGAIAPGSAAGSDDVAAVRAALVQRLRLVPRLDLVRSAAAVDTTGERYPRRVIGLAGALERAADGPWHLEIRRTDARSDSLQYIYRVRGSTLPEVAQRMAVQIAMSFGLPLPPDPAPDAPLPAAPPR
jgi:hypothetical protein